MVARLKEFLETGRRELRRYSDEIFLVFERNEG
jgi:hypothetical protein